MEQIIKKILDIEKIEYKEIRKSSSGFTNDVFFVDDKYVIKLCKDKNKTYKIDVESAFYKNCRLPFIPNYISSGEFEGDKYLIITKLNGQNLYEVWHKLDDEKREDIVKQIANILMQIHKQGYDYLPSKRVGLDWVQKWQRVFERHLDEFKKRNIDSTRLEKFIKTKLGSMMAEQKLGLVYNDAHFDNFLLDGDEVKLIDFDRIMYGSIDYELLIIKSMLNNPCKFASVDEEKFIKKEDYKNVWGLLKKYYPEMFDFERFEDRLFVYQFFYNLGNAYENKNDEQVKKEILDFEKHFNL